MSISDLIIVHNIRARQMLSLWELVEGRLHCLPQLERVLHLLGAELVGKSKVNQ